MTKQDLVGIHPIAKTMEMNIDNPGLPAPNIGGLIEGGDWQNAHRTGKLDVVKEHSIWIMIVLVLLLFVIGKRKFLRSRFHGVSRPQPITTTESPTQTNKETTPLTEKINLDGEEGSADGPSSGEGTSAAADDEVPAQPEKKRRKRGQRGGKNNKKKVGFADPDGDDDDQGENGEPNGTVQAVAIPKDIPLNDQGNHNIDGLTVTDNLLGLPRSRDSS